MYDGGVVEFDIEQRRWRREVVSGLWMPHNPAMIRGQLHYCDSMRGRVHSATYHPLVEIHGFARGLAYDGQFYYVGQSMQRYIDRRQGTTNNISLNTGVFMVEESSKVTKFFALPKLVNIHSVFIPSWDEK